MRLRLLSGREGRTLPNSYFYVNSVSPTRSRDDALPLSRRVDFSPTDLDSAHGQAHKLHASCTQRFRKRLSVALEQKVCCLFDSASVRADVGTSLYMQCSTVPDLTRTMLSRSCISISHSGVRRPRSRHHTIQYRAHLAIASASPGVSIAPASLVCGWGANLNDGVSSSEHGWRTVHVLRECLASIAHRSCALLHLHLRYG
ncbi:hypothetical protein B0H19DRAFT_1151015 [Mycena capillaripes]|nr:hypothetical protein B0H19DRAFT_1151015 [Mycena capillaripes]